MHLVRQQVQALRENLPCKSLSFRDEGFPPKLSPLCVTPWIVLQDESTIPILGG